MRAIRASRERPPEETLLFVNCAKAALRPDAVLVLGMHRSGTSSVAGALVRLGGDAPLHMTPPKPDNERGYWESSVIMELNGDVLAAGDSDWTDWRKFDCGRIGGPFVDGLRARAKAALIAEFADARIPVIKDPRMCRLMGFWAPVFEEAGWSARAVLPLRSPLEVACSLKRRDGLRLAYGCLLWLRHVLDAEAETRGMARAILDWPEFLDDRRSSLTRISEQLGLVWPRWHERALAEVPPSDGPDREVPFISVFTATDVRKAHIALNSVQNK